MLSTLPRQQQQGSVSFLMSDGFWGTSALLEVRGDFLSLRGSVLGPKL